MSFLSILSGVFGNRCPSCQKGHVFHGLVFMNRKCPSCSLVFEKEPGFFLGASVVAYFLGAFSLVPLLIVCLLILDMEIIPVLVIGSIQILALTPLLWRFSRLLWLYLERRMTSALESR